MQPVRFRSGKRGSQGTFACTSVELRPSDRKRKYCRPCLCDLETQFDAGQCSLSGSGQGKGEVKARSLARRLNCGRPLLTTYHLAKESHPPKVVRILGTI